MPMKKTGTYVSKKKMITLGFSLFASPAAGKTAMETVHFTTLVECAEIGII